MTAESVQAVVSAIPPTRLEGQAISEPEKRKIDLGSHLCDGNKQTIPLAAEELSSVDPSYQSRASGFLH